MEQAFEMVENLTQDLVDKEDIIIKLEKLVKDKDNQIKDMKLREYYYKIIRPKIMVHFIDFAITNRDDIDMGEIYFRDFINNLNNSEYEEVSITIQDIIEIFDDNYCININSEDYIKLFYIEILKENNDNVKIYKSEDLLKNIIYPVCHKVLMGVDNIKILERFISIVEDICQTYDWKELEIIRYYIGELGNAYENGLFKVEDLFKITHISLLEGIMNDIVAGLIDIDLCASTIADNNLYNIEIIGELNTSLHYYLVFKNVDLIKK